MKNFNVSEKSSLRRIFIKAHPKAIYDFDDALGERNIKCDFLKGRKVLVAQREKQCTLRVPIKCCWSLRALQKWALSLCT